MCLYLSLLLPFSYAARNRKAILVEGLSRSILVELF